ncbi:MAG: hypothetical protein HC817_11085 [Saprospiraceae bacterium]|nr:hypothetical protein [Saprospiraceae bacterium]
MAAYTRLDAVMLERMLPDGKIQTDIFAAGYRLLEAVNVVGFLFAGLLLPMFSRMLQKKESVASLLRFSYQIIWVGTWTIAIVRGFFATKLWHYFTMKPPLFRATCWGF